VVLTPWLSDKTREQRRQHILTSAWRCFSRDGFHATSIEDVIAATGMSSSSSLHRVGEVESSPASA
jgi:AcrR family transcriptional regulator